MKATNIYQSSKKVNAYSDLLRVAYGKKVG